MFTDKYRVLDDEYKNYLLTFTQNEYNDIDKPYRRRWTQEITKYALNYNHFDVSLAPLLDTEFNFNKSQLKVIEAGFHKKAIIASEVRPYILDLTTAVNQGVFNDKGNSLLVPPAKNHKEWAKHMKRLMDNPNMIEDLGNRLYETVKDKYSLQTVSESRTQFFKSIINK
jgi:glycosyltransferase involved in cell wall biosynthesis